MQRGVPVYFAVHAPGRGPAWEKENMGCLGGGEKREKKKGKKEGTFDNRIHRFKSVFPRICCYPRWKLIFFPPRYFIPDIPRFFSRSSDITNKLESYYFRRVILANVLQFRFQKERYFLRIFNFSSTWSSRTTDTTVILILWLTLSSIVARKRNRKGWINIAKMVYYLARALEEAWQRYCSFHPLYALP